MITSKNRFIALVLSIIMVILSFPINVFATSESFGSDSNENLNSKTSTIEYDSLEIIDSESVESIKEIEELREESVKHFMLDDGTYKAVMYATPIHRKDENGIWQDIDNSLALNDIRGVQSISTPDNRIVFSKSYQPNSQIFLLSENGYSISMNLVENAELSKSSVASSQKVTQSTPVIDNYDKDLDLEVGSLETAFKTKNKSSISYKDIKSNIDVEYILYGNNIKENIIINSSCEDYEIVFNFELTNLTAELDKVGNIIIVDSKTKETKYTIPVPTMYDNNGTECKDVYYELRTSNDNNYSLEIVTNEAWLNSNTRSYPVIVEQSILTTGNISDTYTFSSFPDAILGFDPDLWVSNDHTTYIKTNLPTLPEGAIISNAHLYVSYYSTATSGSMLSGAYQISSYWNEGMTYNNSPQISTTRLSTVVFNATDYNTEDNPRQTCFDITTAAQSWYNQNAQNHGIALKRETSSTHTNTHTILKAYEAFDNDHAYIDIHYVYIPDGVYAIKNAEGSYWMKIESDSNLPGEKLQQKNLDHCPADTFSRHFLFKISRVEGTNRYIIRSMLNNQFSIGITGNKIVTKTIPYDDADVEEEDTFFIEWRPIGFCIRPYGSSLVINMEDTTIADLSLIPQSDALFSTSHWKLVKYTGEDKCGGSLRNNISVGTTKETSVVTWSTKINYNTPYASIASGYENYATLSWNNAENKGYITLHHDGSVGIDYRIYNANKTSYDMCLSYFDSRLLVDEGVYYIKNKENEQYVQINDDDSHDYRTMGAAMELWNLDENDYQKWKFVHIVDGYYKIISCESGLALSVQSNHLDDENCTIVQEPYIENYRQQWKITKASYDTFVIRPKSAEVYDTDWCMGISDQIVNGSDALNVVQQEYVSDADHSYLWELEEFPQYMSLEAQEQDKWCWAACARMSSFNYQDSTISQASAAVYVKLGVETDNPTDNQKIKANDGGTVSETERALEYILGKNNEDYVGNVYSVWGKIYDESTVRSLLDCSNPIIILRGLYNTNGGRTKGHYTIIYDYYWDFDKNIYMYKIYDPWPVDNGNIIEKSYQNIRNGKNQGFDGEAQDDWLWEGVVVYTKGDYLNTIDSPAA